MTIESLKSTPEVAYFYNIILKFPPFVIYSKMCNLVLDNPDKIIWKFTNNGSYSASSA
jgi:hypothetical protein